MKYSALRQVGACCGTRAPSRSRCSPTPCRFVCSSIVNFAACKVELSPHLCHTHSIPGIFVASGLRAAREEAGAEARVAYACFTIS
eukprot:COSAG01_NODE_709_length_14119_cov_107.401213_12_plen_86_part_00